MPDNSDSDYYGAGSPNGDATSASADPNPEDSAAPNSDDENQDGQTALLPKSVFGDNVPAVGDDLVVKVEHVWEDEIEVSYVKSETPSKNGPGKKRSTMDDAMSAMDQMNQPPDEE